MIEGPAGGRSRGKPFIVVAAVFLAAMLAAQLALTAAFEGGLSFAQVYAGARFSALLYVVSCAGFYSFKLLRRVWPEKPLSTPDEIEKAAFEQFVGPKD
ncbi:hypothetical protein [Phenylobacterium sp. NIBR 498073]|uniref:hypothetical protein n=1 Tax=Phenylobacterium sp. NIBR 498073 TaxID=3015177 RepID=UPI0022B52772|nr:hypothetical protein [Phenylobacterium sp. NIBR 498073]WGU40954.1 hypothetical protein O4N75_04320 [Phenylobacterium sp. NIBR 498073]